MSPSRGGTGYSNYSGASHSRTRRASPVYDDFPGYIESAGSTQTSYEVHGSGAPDSSRRYHSTAVGSSRPPRRSTSPPKSESQQAGGSSRRSPKPFIYAGANLYPTEPKALRNATPPPTQRTTPSEEYIATSLDNSVILEDPSSLRKLVVLDLNGSLLLRSPHKKLPGRPHPYSNHTLPRPVRVVHRRPYLSAFTAFLLHEETRKWLDVMVWSSAQPHSVEDMVDKCFGERKSELKAIWARDTLGLSQDQYNQKTQTMKDLEKPWSKLGLAEEETPESKHSARTTILVDDSPLKAALQPWNHLCIKEYLSETRKWDLGVADWEAAKDTARQAHEALEQEKLHHLEQAHLEIKEMSRESVGEDVIENGKKFGEETNADNMMAPKDDGFTESSLTPKEEERRAKSAKKEKRKLKKLAKKETTPKHDEESKKAALLAYFKETDTENSATEFGDHETQLARMKDKLKFDETLLAVVGVLDHIKTQSNVAAWLKGGGLLRTALLDNGDVSANSRSESPVSESPPKKRRIGSHSSPSTPPASSPQPSDLLGFEQPEVVQDAEQSTGVPLHTSLTPKDDQQVTPSHNLWFEQPEVLVYWADRGRLALEQLEIPVHHGIVPSSG